MLSMYIPFTIIKVVLCNEIRLKFNYFIGRWYLYVNINLNLKPNLNKTPHAQCTLLHYAPN